MPVYCEQITVPANTSESNPITRDITIEEKFITRMEVMFPDGCCNLVKVRIHYGIKRFWPSKEGTWIVGNGETVGWEERFEMPAVNETLTVLVANLDDTYSHTIVVRIMTLPRGFYFLETLIQKIAQLWEKII
jgi:hypothetical protein